MLFSPDERKRIRKILLGKIQVTDEQLEACVDSLLALAVELNKICGRHSAARRNWRPKKD